MNKKLVDRKTEVTIAFIVLCICCLYFTSTYVAMHREARRLKEVCTATTQGYTISSVYHKGSSRQLKAQFEYNGNLYYSRGMYNNENYGEAVIVHYNPKNISDNYCGKSPVHMGFIEYFIIIALYASIIYLILNLKKLYSNSDL